MKFKLAHVYTNEIGKLLYTTLVNTETKKIKHIEKEEFIKLVRNNKVENIRLGKNGRQTTLLMNKDTFYTLDFYVLKTQLDGIEKLEKIKYMTGKNAHHILSAIVKTKSVRDASALESLGAKRITKTSVELSNLLIQHLVAKNAQIREKLAKVGIVVNNHNVTYYNTSNNPRQHDTIFEIDSEYVDKLDKWDKKMKLLGLRNNFIIEDDISLKEARDSNSHNILPPVLYIEDYALIKDAALSVEDLKIPDSVVKFEFNIMPNLKSIELGKNTVHIMDKLYESEIDYFDTKNLVSGFHGIAVTKITLRLSLMNMKLGLCNKTEQIEIAEGIISE